jgi:prepilin-type N-terminal cleavage/methylation domain-containing protein
MRRGGNRRIGKKQAERGFSLIEVLISMVILTVGLVSLLGVFGLAMASTLTSQEDMIAKQLANETMESIVTARNTSQLGWDDIQNQGSITCTGPINPCGLFVSTTTAILNAGPDGIYGTQDDTGEATLTEPGPDGIYGTSDDVVVPLTGYQRTIAITPATDSNGNPMTTLRQVIITIQYSTTQTRLPKTYVLTTLISQYQ